MLISGKLRILHETRDALGRPDREFLTTEAFLTWEGEEKYFYGATRQMPIGSAIIVVVIVNCQNSLTVPSEKPAPWWDQPQCLAVPARGGPALAGPGICPYIEVLEAT